MTFVGFKPETTKSLAVKFGVALVLIVSAYYGFFSRYKIFVDYYGNRCLDARVFLIDLKDKELREGKLVALTGDGIPLLDDSMNYIKFIGGLEGTTVNFEGITVENSNGFQRYAPTNDQYRELKRRHNLPTEWIVGEGEVFLFGDTHHSLDSRVVGLADASTIFGTAYVIL